MSQRQVPNPFLEKMSSGRTAFGTFVFSKDPAVTEIVAAAGFDLAIIDTEHAPLTISDVVDHARAAQATSISCWARVAAYDAAEIGRLLDAGIQGLIFPHFGMEQPGYHEGLAALRYAPQGTRPTCTGVRASAFGTEFSAYVERSNRDVFGVGLVEDGAAVDRIEDVLDGCQLSAVMPGGGGDLATSLGLHGQGNHPDVIAAGRRVVEAARKHPQLKAGVYVSDLETAKQWSAWGADFFIYSIDYKVLCAAYEAIRKTLGSALSKAGAHTSASGDG